MLENYNLQRQVFNVGIYTRLSRDDDDKSNGKSESIQNQINFLTKYVVENEWNLFNIYSDDGYTGTNFNRPGFKQMIQDIETKQINLIITKDLSRLGRDYIDTGYYYEKYFPSQNVRYIAVNDGIDTFINSSGNDMGPFKSVINDMYARDISQKVKSVMDTKRLNGEFIGAFAPYGYFKDPLNKSKLVIDLETEDVIKNIFNTFLQGHGYSYIANLLNSEGVLPPVSYKAAKTNYKNPKSILRLWTHETIKSILTNPTYAGNITQGKLGKVNYKIKQLKALPKNQWITVNGTHQGIIDENTFTSVQRIINKNNASEFTEKKYTHLLSGLLFCGDCGSRMTFFKTPRGKMYVLCSKYKRFPKLRVCTRHSFVESELESIVIKSLKEISRKALEPGKLENVVKKNTRRNKADDLGNEFKKTEVRLNDIKHAIKNLYEDKLKKIIGEEDFIDLSHEYNKEREQLNKRLNKIIEQQKENDIINNESSDLMKIVISFANFDTIDKIILLQLINNVEVFENKKIRIQYKFKNPF